MLVRGLFARATGRALVSDRDWYPVAGGYCRDIPGGILLLRQIGETWVVHWATSTRAKNSRPIAHGSRGEVEQDIRELILFGLPGGAEPPGRPWRFEEGSLHHKAGDGSFRLMLQDAERGGLLFVRHDAAVFFLGEGRVDALIRSADARLGHLGSQLHVWFAGRRLPLRGVGVIGVVGQAELARDVHIVLVHVDYDRYELHVATIGDATSVLGVYTGADLLRGDLGASASHTTQTPPLIESSARPQVESSARPQQAKARRLPPPVADRAAQPPPPPPPPASFTEEDHQRLDTCLTPRRKEYTGAGASAMPHVYEGLRLITEDALKCPAEALRQYGSPLRAKAIRKLMEAKRKEIPGHQRTFTRGLVRVLAETGLGERVRRRIQLHLADWPRIISMLRANYEPAVRNAGRSSPPSPAPNHTDTPAAAPSSSRPRADACASAPPTGSPPPHTITSVGEPPVGDVPSSSTPPSSRADATGSPLPHTITVDEPPVGDLPQPEDHDHGLGEPVVGGWHRTLRQDGRPTYYERLYDRTDGDSPSRFPGVNPNRGPPDSGSAAGAG
jgi:hypothetical protein